MLFVKTYAQVSFVVAVLLAVYNALSMHTLPGGSGLEATVLVVSTLWLFVSIMAILTFPEYKVPILAPVAFILYGAGNVLVTLGMGMAFKQAHVAQWLFALKKSPLPLYWARLGFCLLYIVLNALLLWRRPAPRISVEAECRKQ